MKKEKKEKSNVEQIQFYISEGREVLVKKPDEKTLVCIRCNEKDIDGTKKWILLLNGNEFLSKEIKINIPVKTESIRVEGIGLKHYTTCLADEIKFNDNIAYIN